MALDGSGNLFICDTGNHRIREVTPNGSVTTVAGSIQGFADGPGNTARFNAPCGICLSTDGAIYIADSGNGSVRCIRNGLVTTIIRERAGINSRTSPLPVAIAFRAKPTPHLLVLDADSKTLNLYGVDGKYLSGFVQPEPTIIDRGYSSAGHETSVSKRVIPIAGADEIPEAQNRPALRHLTGECNIGSGSLVADEAYGALFFVKQNSAEILAGVVNSAEQIKEWRDGNGENAFFGDITAVITDNARFVYVADTGNNCIRRLTLPDFMFKQ
jgi:hypothetical protein